MDPKVDFNEEHLNEEHLNFNSRVGRMKAVGWGMGRYLNRVVFFGFFGFFYTEFLLIFMYNFPSFSFYIF